MTAAQRIDRNEWRLVGQAMSAAELDEIDREVVWLTAGAGGRRRWVTGRTPGTVIEVTGGRHDGEAVTLELSPRLVDFAVRLSEREGHCALSVVDGVTAVVAAGDASVGIDLVDAPFPDVAAVEAYEAFAELRLDRLAEILHASATAPPGIDMSVTTGPPFWLGIESGFVVVHVDWNDACAPRATYRAAASTEGAAMVVISPRVLGNMLVRADSGSDTMVRVDADPGHRHVTVTGDSWRLVTPTVDVGVTRFGPDIDAVLAEAELDREWISPWVVVFGRAREVRAELHPGPPEIVRLSTVVATRIPATAEVLAEINQANAGLVGLRVWTENDSIVAAVDMECRHIADLVTTSARMARQTDGLGAFLTAMAGKA